MYKFIAPAIFVMFIISAAFNSEAHLAKDKGKPAPVSLGEFLYTVPLQKEISTDDAQTRWYHEYFEPQVNDSVFGPMLDLIKNKEIEVCEPVYPFTTKMDRQAAKDIFVMIDSTDIEDSDNPGTFIRIAVKSERWPDDITSLTFHEEWKYDPASLTLTKTVIGIIPNIHSWEMGERSTCYIPISNQPSNLPTMTVYGITSDFIADGTTHSQPNSYYRLSWDSAVSANQAGMTQRILTDINLRVKEKEFEVYHADFPFTRAVDKKQKPEKVTKIQGANMLTFSEDWEINPRSRVFRKKVRGIIPMQEKLGWNEDSTSQYWTSESSAFVPFNGVVPVKPDPHAGVIDRISYNMNYKETPIAGVPWISQQDSIRVDSIAFDIREHVKRREIKSYGHLKTFDACDPFLWTCTELNEEQVRNLFYVYDTVYTEYIDTYQAEPRVYELGHELTTGFRFFETWKFDYVNQTFNKITKFIGANRMVLDPYGEVKNYSSFIYYYVNPDVGLEQWNKPPYVYRTSVTSGTMMNYNEFNYNEDDYGGKIINYYDDWFENIPASKRYAFLQPVIDMVLGGKMKAYSSVSVNDPMTPAGFSQMMNAVASKYSLTLAPGMEFALFNQVYFHEQWYYNLATGQIQKEVNAITFAHRDWDTYNPDTYEHAVHIDPCFTIKLNAGK